MPPCTACQQPATKRNGRDRRGRQKCACRQCRRTFTEHTGSVFSGYRWSADVILTAARWYLAYLLSSRQVLELLAERGIDVSHRRLPSHCVNWVQAFAPRLDDQVRRCARHIRTGLHRARGETTKTAERSYVPTRDRRRNSRGLKRTEQGSTSWKATKRCGIYGVVADPVRVTW